jgi:hypothetical protein
MRVPTSAGGYRPPNCAALPAALRVPRAGRHGALCALLPPSLLHWCNFRHSKRTRGLLPQRMCRGNGYNSYVPAQTTVGHLTATVRGVVRGLIYKGRIKTIGRPGERDDHSLMPD